jgi:hypothetical protein
MSSGLCLNWWISGDMPAERIPANFPFPWAKRTLAQYLDLRDNFYGDFHPLTSYSQARDTWMAYQLHRPAEGRGMVVVLRRPESPYESARFALRGLDEKADYRITNLDTGALVARSGADLAQGGFEAVLQAKPGSVLLTYERR